MRDEIEAFRDWNSLILKVFKAAMLNLGIHGLVWVWLKFKLYKDFKGSVWT